MKFLSTTVLGLAGFASLATAAPLTEAEPGISPAPAPLKKRSGDYQPNHYCGDKNWASFGERAALAGFRLMGGVDTGGFSAAALKEILPSYSGHPGQCLTLWCGGDGDTSVAFLLCVKPGAAVQTYYATDIAQKLHDGFYDCFDREPIDEKRSALPYHVWEGDYSLHVENSHGMRCPQDMRKDRFPYPASFSSSPYKEYNA